jgi:hypothetical protein
MPKYAYDVHHTLGCMVSYVTHYMSHTFGVRYSNAILYFTDLASYDYFYEIKCVIHCIYRMLVPYTSICMYNIFYVGTFNIVWLYWYITISYCTTS